MIVRDTSSRQTHPATLGNMFTSDELQRLATLRDDYIEHAEYSEFLTDAAHLEFARWLYDQGRISEHPNKSVSKR